MVIYQGGKIISEDDFYSHLYSLCQLDNVGVLLGAGASVGCGGQTMKQVWQSFKYEHPDLLNLLLEKYLLVDKTESEQVILKNGDNLVGECNRITINASICINSN